MAQLTVVGNLTADPEIRQAGGANVASFTIAEQERKFDKQANEWVDGQVTFIRCQAWRELADHVAASLTKGTRVVASGKFQQRDYETREGATKTSYELTVDEIGPSLKYATAEVQRAGTNRNQQQRQEQFRAQGQGSAPRQQQQPVQQQPVQQQWAGGGYDDDVPF